jgi:hypothetical protein
LAGLSPNALWRYRLTSAVAGQDRIGSWNSLKRRHCSTVHCQNLQDV